jgi:hypothetical protein
MISPARATELLRKADAAANKLATVKKKTEEKAGEVFKLLETVGAGLGVGCLRGKYGAVEVGPGIPLEALIGAGLHTVGFLDLAGKHSEHVHNLGNAVLTTWAALEGVKLMGGAVLSESETKRLAVTAPAKQVTAGETQQQKAPEKRHILNGRAQTAREVVEEHAAEVVPAETGRG